MITEVDYRKLNSIIKKVERIYKRYNKSQVKNGGGFNMCSILRKNNDEVNLHSKFIYELINPCGSHSQENFFLKLFIEESLEIKDFDYNDIVVVREDLTKSLDRNRKIDFVIKSSNYLIGIEMKIDAIDQDKQLYDYYQELKLRQNRKKYKQKIKLYYLTKYGTEPTKKSTHLLSKKDKNYDLLSFNIDIDWWLSKCIEKTKIDKLKESISQYQEVVQKITGQLPKEIEQEMDTLIKNEQDIKLVHSLIQDYPRVWAKKEADFWNELYHRINYMTINKIKNSDSEYMKIDLHGSKNNYNYDDISYEEQIKIIEEYRKKNMQQYFGLIIKINFNKHIFQIEIKQRNNSELSIDISLYGARGAIKDNKILSDILKEELKFKYFNSKMLIPNITFYGKGVLTPSFELFNEKEFNKYLSESTKEIKKVLVVIEENKNNILP